MATKLKGNIEERTKPYMGYYKAFELIDPTAPNKDVLPVAPETWDAVEDLVKRFGREVGGIDFETLRDEILAWQNKGDKFGTAQQVEVRQNVLRYFHDMHERDVRRKSKLEASVISSIGYLAIEKAQVRKVWFAQGF